MKLLIKVTTKGTGAKWGFPKLLFPGQPRDLLRGKSEELTSDYCAERLTF